MTTTEFHNQFEALRPTLFAFAMKLTRNTEDAKDLMQETAFRAFRGLERFQDGTHFKSWCSTILRNNFINEYRKKRTRNKVISPLENNDNTLESIPTNRNNPNNAVLMGELKRLINALNPKYKTPFVMYFQGYSYDEVANTMNLPIGTIKSRIFYARKELKERIRANYGEQTLRAAA